MPKKRSIQQKTGELLKVAIATILLFLLVDVVLGAWVISLVRPSEPFRVRHPVYHHTLKPNYDGLGRWGTWSYRICTNAEGFKTNCVQKNSPQKKFDVAFIGDSFTEGVGLPYEETFVGMVAAKNPELTIANLGVVSYSPAIYLSKLKALYAEGYRFKHVIVFIDIGDAYDEANSYDLHNNTIVVDKGEPYPLSIGRKLRRFASQHLPLTGEAWVQIRKLAQNKHEQPSRAGHVVVSAKEHTPVTLADLAKAPLLPPNHELKQKRPMSDGANTEAPDDASSQANTEAPFIQNIYEGVYLKNYPKSEWTYNNMSPHYGPNGVSGAINKMKDAMLALAALTQFHGSTLSVGVYPWPGQIKYDVVESQQVKIWREFCQSHCRYFYNLFPAFFKLAQEQGSESVIYQYYFQGDVHFTELGNQVIARTILDVGVK